MSLLVEALQPHIAPSLVGFSTLPECGFEQALERPYALRVEATGTSLHLDYRDPQLTGEVFATDASRLASAAFQTILTVERDGDEADLLAWRLIRLYYSAFYAAHALLRYLGRAYVYLPARLSRSISDMAPIYGVSLPFALTAGQYEAVLASGTIQLIQPPATRPTPHEGFWRVFGLEVGRLGSEILNGPLPSREAQSATGKLVELRAILNRTSGADNWLCFVRNELQYRHRMGVWFPLRPRRAACEDIDRRLLRWNRDPMLLLSGERSDIGDFVSACVFLLALCRGTTIRIEDRSPARRSFVAFGPLRLLREAGRA